METTETKKEHWTYEPPTKPAYLSFLRFFATIEAIVGGLAFVIFITTLIGSLKEGYGDTGGGAWIYFLALAIQGFLAFGLLNAVADIAENLILIGRKYKTDSIEKG